jgi:hypothetical protein
MVAQLNLTQMEETLEKNGAELIKQINQQVKLIGLGAYQKWIMIILDNMLMIIMKMKLRL